MGLILAVAGLISRAGAAADSFPFLYEQPDQFVSAIRATRVKPFDSRITGITVPHHLIAADLVAYTFGRISGTRYDLIIILTPDHFARSLAPFATTRKDFRTVMGTVSTDKAGVTELLRNDFVAESELFSHEHGIQALLPFIRHYMPAIPVVPVAISPSAKPAQWQSLAESLLPLITRNTLIVQSTDFSHHLTHEEARARDQETLRVLSAGDPDGIIGLSEPAHLDSRGAQYLQMMLQRKQFHAGPVVIANHNSQEYAKERLTDTTSYIVQIYSPEPAEVEAFDSFFFAGDTFFGRHMAKLLESEDRLKALQSQIHKITGRAKLIANLEGVIAERCPEKAGPYDLCMEADLTIQLLKRLNVVAVSLANNHWKDLREQPHQHMKRLLREAGITALEDQTVSDLGRFRLIALTDVDNSRTITHGILRSRDLDFLHGAYQDKPLFAFLHWGREYQTDMGPREHAIQSTLRENGVRLIVGSHSHTSSGLSCDNGGCGVFSLGNFIFDQLDPRVSGKLLEVVFFPQGTYFLRLHDLGNLYGSLVPARGKRP